MSDNFAVESLTRNCKALTSSRLNLYLFKSLIPDVIEDNSLNGFALIDESDSIT